ncbi:MAG: ABC transporter permease [Lachnospiraceae bacterium]|nr:ABC transporter permease [Lachnospiraceae bacterium]
MVRYIIKRIVAGFLSLLMLITLTFFLMHAIPGGPFSSDKYRKTPQAVLEQIQDQYGLNEPVYVQYISYLQNLAKGNLGVSFTKLNYSVNDLISNGMPASAKIGFLAILLALMVGIPLGTTAAVRRGHLADGVSMVIATVGVSVPSFVLCVLTMYLFCDRLKLLPTYGLSSWKCYILPVGCMAFGQIAYITRLMRSSMLETLRQDFIRTERSKGISELAVIGKYALKNSILPVITYMGPMVATLLTGTFIIEKVFSIPGLGRYFVNAIGDRDYAVTLGLTIFVGALIIICNLIVDIIYAFVDPRVKIDR